jgi:hypothetical protein
MSAFHAFKRPRVSADGKTLFLDGHRRAGFEAVKIQAVIIALRDDDKRLEDCTTGSPLSDDWTVTIDQSQLPAAERFGKDEEAYLVGVATSKDGETFVWGGVTDGSGGIATTSVEGKPDLSAGPATSPQP